MKPIVGFEGLYSIYNDGKVFSHIKCRFLKPTLHRGYYGVRLYRDSKPKFFSVHRLVGIHFIPNLEDKPELNHKDGNKLNNHFENLEWVTDQENTLHSWRTGLSKYRLSQERIIKSSKKCRRFSPEIEEKIREEYGQGKLQREVAEKFECSRQLIMRIINKKHKVQY